jgi:hypothetical protein
MYTMPEHLRFPVRREPSYLPLLLLPGQIPIQFIIIGALHRDCAVFCARVDRARLVHLPLLLQILLQVAETSNTLLQFVSILAALELGCIKKSDTEDRSRCLQAGRE